MSRLLLLLLPAALAGRPVPALHQGVLPACATFSAAAVARSYGERVDPLALQRAVPVTAAGVRFEDVVAALARQGVHASVIFPPVTGVRGLLAHGMPVVLMQARPRGLDHALVVHGYDATTDRYQVMDPANPSRPTMPAAQVDAAFTAAGRRALLVLPPS